MSEIDNEDVIALPDELTTLKARADLLGIAYHPSIGVEKLREKVLAAMADKPVEVKPVVPVSAEEAEAALRTQQRNAALELVRIRVSCMNPTKKEWEGEIFCVGNNLVGTQKKFVPFNADDGWHVPRVIYNMIVDRECQIFVTVKDDRGNKIRRGKLIKEFAVEVLPNLTSDELNALAQRQAMAKTID